MNIIEKIEIKNFRSFGNRKKLNFELQNIKSVNIISGSNDSGKSNILRALNLFFNKNTNLNEFFDFEKDFFKKRILDNEDIKEELVTIKIHFVNSKNNGKNRIKPEKIFLPEKFWVSRKYKRNSEYSAYTQDSSILTDFKREKKGLTYNEANKNIKASLEKQLTDFIDSIQYHYVPAIKDKEYFSHLYGELQQTLWKAKSSPVINTQKKFQEAIQTTTQTLMDEFKSIANAIDNFAPFFELPQNLIEIFKTLSVNTGSVDLKLRGDGIQAKLIPEILYFIALQEKQLTSTKIKSGQKAKKYFIWGFEEPENSYEYKNAQLLADRFKDIFSKEVQIFLTTHAFNFLTMNGIDVSLYRAWKDISIQSSRINYIKKSNQGQLNLDLIPTDNDTLKDELGVFELNQKLEEVYKELEDKRVNLINKLEEINLLTKELTKPILISEGKNKTYIEKLKEFYLGDLDFEILDQKELGDSEIQKLFDFLLKTQNKEPKKLFVLDCDSNSKFESLQRKKTKYLEPFIFEINNSNNKVRRGIENLFKEELFSNTARFYPKKEKFNEYGSKTTIEEFNKNEFEKFICEERNIQEDFEKFLPLVEKIKEYFGENQNV